MEAYSTGATEYYFIEKCSKLKFYYIFFLVHSLLEVFLKLT